MRIVTLTCSNTEIVCALGCEDQLVGVDDYSDYPPEVLAGLPRLGPDLNIDIDAVAKLNPDLVLASLTVPGHERVVEGLQEAGLPYIAPEPNSLEDVYSDIREIGELLGVSERATRIVQEMRETIKPPTSVESRPSVIVQWWPKPVIAPGKHSWVQFLMDAAGLENPLALSEVKSTPLTDEEVREYDPDAMVISWCGVQYDKYRPKVIYRNPIWQDTKFVKNRNVFKISEAYLGRPSPRLMDGFRELQSIAQQLGGATNDKETIRTVD